MQLRPLKKFTISYHPSVRRCLSEGSSLLVLSGFLNALEFFHAVHSMYWHRDHCWSYGGPAGALWKYFRDREPAHRELCRAMDQSIRVQCVLAMMGHDGRFGHEVVRASVEFYRVGSKKPHFCWFVHFHAYDGVVIHDTAVAVPRPDA